MRKIGEYTVDDTPIGIGGMGKILKGEDDHGHTVAIKEILPEFATNLEILKRIEQEIKILWDLEHKGVVKIYSSYFDEVTESYYIIMELVDGMNIEQFIEKNGPIPADLAAQLMIEILDIMQYVHSKGYIHRDIKPSNIMIRENMSICILDFGVARDTNLKESLTQYGSVIGTDGYMSPEQADGFNIDRRSDIYGLGCVFFYMLTGHHAFSYLGSDYETMEAIRNESFPRLSKYLKNADERLQIILDNATDKNMLKRYQTCNEFAKSLRNSTIIRNTPSSSVQTSRISVSIGSEMCDIIITDPGRRISRHHADVSLRMFTGTQYYVFTDTSRNGSLVNGKQVYNDSVTIRCHETPEILLARLKDAKVDWDLVKRMLHERARAVCVQNGAVDSETPPPPPPPLSNHKWMVMIFIAAIIITMLFSVLITLLLI